MTHRKDEPQFAPMPVTLSGPELKPTLNLPLGRRMGKTSDTLAEACKVARHGNTVLVLVSSEGEVENAKRIVDGMLGSLTNRELVRKLINIRCYTDVDTMRVRGRVFEQILEDHHVKEVRDADWEGKKLRLIAPNMKFRSEGASTMPSFKPVECDFCEEIALRIRSCGPSTSRQFLCEKHKNVDPTLMGVGKNEKNTELRTCSYEEALAEMKRRNR